MLENMKSAKDITVHVGLGKTGTTTLQACVYPELEKMGYLDAYNPREVTGLLQIGANLGGYGNLQGEINLELLIGDRLFFSDERLAGWNPALWEERCGEVEKLFGEDATIIITLRDPGSYLRSMYQQIVHQGNIIRPHQFFLSRENYETFSRITRFRFNEVCDIDTLCYRSLVAMYASRFRKVIVVPFSRIKSLAYISEFCDVTDEDLEKLIATLSSAPRKNQSYSSLAMSLTFLRERALNFVGLKTLGTHDRYFYYSPKQTQAAESDFGVGDARPWIDSLKSILRHVVTWRGLMQSIVSRAPNAKRYELPPDICRGVHFADNQDFYNEICAEQAGYRVLKNDVL